jgi:hypothetical protein
MANRKRVTTLTTREVDDLSEVIDAGNFVGIHLLRCLAYTTRQLRLERRVLAKLARPQHTNGGFHNPLEAFAVQKLADDILDGRDPRDVSDI